MEGCILLSVKDAVLTFIKKNQLLHPGATVLLGVSGGADSMALLYFLNSIKAHFKLHLIVVSVDHGLRGKESEADVLFVKNYCEERQITFEAEKVNVLEKRKQEKMGTQLAARELRYHIFANLLKKHQADYVALAHHADDQAETMLMRFVRNATPNALTGIQPKRNFEDGRLIRPFLPLRKMDILNFCKEHEIPFREDPSNQSTDYTRNYYRLKILPLLEEQNPLFSSHMNQLSKRMREEQDYLREQTEAMLKEIVTFSENKKYVHFKIDAFKAYPITLQRRAFHLILSYLYQALPIGLSAIHEDNFLSFLHTERANASIELPRGLFVKKVYDQISLSFTSYQAINQSTLRHSLEVPGEVCLPNGATITASITPHRKQQNESTYEYTCPIYSDSFFPLLIRGRQNGDRIRVRGLLGHKKIKDIFINEKIPKELRDAWPVVETMDGQIIWVVGLKKGEAIQEQKNSPKGYLKLVYRHADN